MKILISLFVLAGLVAQPLSTNAGIFSNLRPEPQIGVGPGLIAVARDANGADEGPLTYMDFGVRLSHHVTFGLRDIQPPTDQWMTAHDIAPWVRLDTSSYDYNCVDCFTPYVRISWGSLMVTPESAEVLSTAWRVAGGGEFQYSHVFSLFGEAEGAYITSGDQLNELGIKMGGLFRFGTRQ